MNSTTMKASTLNSLTIALAVALATTSIANAGSRSRSSAYASNRDCRMPPPVYVTPRCATYVPSPPVYYRPMVVSRGWDRQACNTTVYRSYDPYHRGYVETRRTVCRPVYSPPPCPPAYPTPYRSTVLSFRF